MANNIESLILEGADRVVREHERKQLTQISRTTAWELEKKGLFPKRRKLTPTSNRVFWLYSEIMAWIKTRELCGEQQ